MPAGGVGNVADDRMKSVVDESTATILREVQSLKSMVDEFTAIRTFAECKA
jgi:nitrogen fixation/metabolism regulation signal transduction histidine kinase